MVNGKAAQHAFEFGDVRQLACLPADDAPGEQQLGDQVRAQRGGLGPLGGRHQLRRGCGGDRELVDCGLQLRSAAVRPVGRTCLSG